MSTNGKSAENGRKTADGTAVKLAPPSPLTGYALPVGAHPGNTGGKPGRSGRKPDAWREECRKALQDSNALGVVSDMVIGKVEETKPADRLGAVKFLAGYAHGQPTEKTEFEGELTIRVAYDD